MWIRWLSLCNFDIIFLVAQNCIRELTFRVKYALCFNGVTRTCFLSSSHSSVKHIKFICFFAELKFKKLCKMDFEALARQSLMALLQYVVVYSIRLNKVQLHIKKKYIILIQLYKRRFSWAPIYCLRSCWFILRLSEKHKKWHWLVQRYSVTE